ncbi:MAG: GTPase HflX [Caldiserica bacterium]|nr:GTPase HflX [Caldisericota bacterium]
MGRGSQRYLIEDYLGRGGERAILVGIIPPGSAEEERETFEELRALAYTAGVLVVGHLVQHRRRPDPATFIGKGKAEELRDLAAALGADTALFNDELSPDQARTLEEVTGLKIVDRTQLILDIFAQRAGTREAELAVELAQLEYLLPRLRGWGKALTNPGGGIGTMGPGETKMEIERRKVKRRIQAVRRALAEADRVREVRRKRRRSASIPQVAIVGYTNSGKSTLFRRLTGEDVLVEDKLFATLDTKTRRVALDEGRFVLLSDTVGSWGSSGSSPTSSSPRSGPPWRRPARPTSSSMCSTLPPPASWSISGRWSGSYPRRCSPPTSPGPRCCTSSTRSTSCGTRARRGCSRSSNSRPDVTWRSRPGSVGASTG